MSKEPTNFEILVVDDDKVVSLLHKNLLRFDHIKPPVIFSNCKNTLEHLLSKNCAENCFLLLLDLHMPVVNGWNLLKEIKNSAFDSTIYVVLVTSSTYKKDQLQALEFENVIGFCEKPLRKEHVDQIQELEELKYFFKRERNISRAAELQKSL